MQKENKPQYMEKLFTKLKEFSKFLGNRSFLAGDHVSIFVAPDKRDQKSKT